MANAPLLLDDDLEIVERRTDVRIVLSLPGRFTLASRRDVTISVSTQRAFETDQVLYRATERVDFVAHDLGTNSVAGPIVALLGKT